MAIDDLSASAPPSRTRLDKRPAISLLREHLLLDDATGTLRWAPRKHACSGRIAGGSVGNGYRGIDFFGARLLCSHVVWALTHGAWPTNQVDHIDGNRQNNAPSNLRLATPGQNCQNVSKARGKSSRFIGVSWDKRECKWVAYIKIDRKLRNLGYFANEEDARDRHLLAKQQIHNFEPISRRGEVAAQLPSQVNY